MGIGENGDDVCQRLPIVRENRPPCIKRGRSSIGQAHERDVAWTMSCNARNAAVRWLIFDRVLGSRRNANAGTVLP